MDLHRIDLPHPITDIVKELVAIATESGLKEVVVDLEQRLHTYMELDARNKEGDTMLHIITQETDKHPKEDSYMIVFDAILATSVKWWCMKQKFVYTDDPQANMYTEYRYQAVRYLTTDVSNTRGLDVMELAFKLGNVQIIEKLLMMENVKCFKVDNKIRYDAYQLTPLTNEAVIQCCVNKVSPRPSLVEWLMSQNSLERISDVLDLEPMRKIEKHYRFFTMLTYLALMIVHTLYMIVFSYCGVVLMENKRDPSSGDVSFVRILFYCVVPIEPVCIIIYGLYMIFKLILCRGEVTVMIKLRSIGFQYMSLFFLLLYVFVVAALIYQLSTQGGNQNNLLSAALLYGWLMTLPLTKGTSRIHYLWKVIVNIFLKDVYKILIIYAFVLLGFSLALHVQFQVSTAIIANFIDPFYTMYNMFNVMVGMGELFPNNTESSLEASGGNALYSKIVYILYIVIATVILLNLLIAMMNTSYSTILHQQTLSWRIESVQLGLELERNFMFLARCFPPSSLHYGQLNPLPSPKTDTTWYIEVEEGASSSTPKAHDLHAKVDRVTERVELLEARMIQDLRRIELLLQNMRDSNESEQ